MSNKVVQWPRIILFGDSLTQHSFDPVDGKWGSLLADRLQRVCDVVTRGFSGYNSRYCRLILPHIFSPENISNICAFIILLGSNDSSGTPGSETVPLSEYQDNLEGMINYLQGIGLSKEKIIIMTPPAYCDEKYKEYCKKIGREYILRDLKTVAQYADACVNVAQDFKVEVVNLFQEMMKSEDWSEYLVDGLHFSKLGSQLVFRLLWPSIERRVDVNNMIFPYWKDFNVNDYTKA